MGDVVNTNPALEFEQAVRLAMDTALKKNVPPTMICGTLTWIAADVREIYMRAVAAQKANGGLPDKPSDIIDLGKIPRN
jgi:hypothetical protein